AFKPEGGPSRALFHLGNHEFHPTGSQAVRVRFHIDGFEKHAGWAVVEDSLPLVKARWVNVNPKKP
ncbi:MAG: hypothetical protein V3T77_04685, partial [Planctomycetota bacterium]